jgi:DNA-binding NarL/FixJ family response regulator
MQASGFSPLQGELKLLVIEDHPVYLEGLSFVLNRLSQQVVVECANGVVEAQARLRQNTSYDLILLDLCLPDEGGLAILKFLSEHQIFIPAVILSASEEQRDVQRAINAGASGFISKSSSSELILNQIKQVLEGDNCLPDFYQETPHTELPQLTPRQKEVLQLVCEGLPNKKICQCLNLTEHTIKSHLKTLFSTLGVHNRTECARVAAELGLLD